MELQINRIKPTIMHIDLNSCFASAEQQANPLLRGKPIAVAAYSSPNGCVLSPSIEAKCLGIKVGMRVKDARLLCKNIVIRTPDPPKYRDIHLKFCKLFRDYSPLVVPKSIDEAVLDFADTAILYQSLVRVGKEIKQRMRIEIGDWISCNIGIAPNRFLAKLAASLHKPDGLDVIDHHNLLQVYAQAKLLDLNGINIRYQSRLNACGIFTPLDFFKASEEKLEKQIFRSIVGRYWYYKLRGFETDAIKPKRKSFGQTYSLGKPTDDPAKLAPMLMKLCEKMGRRLRRGNFVASGIHLAILYWDRTFWHQSKLFHTTLFTTQELFAKIMLLFNYQTQLKTVANLSVSCFGLQSISTQQLSLFELDQIRQRKLARAVDKINDYYGEYVVTPALMMGMHDLIIDRVAFGGVRELEDLYAK
ncbi:hypothetical protein COX08_03625 [Candidatus Beckwithbacteria bacterium CG23_combo_of_CG06-09_8_20_14_all_34_8]|uniref:UmuC domain-containing protein n=1 Tax=Candidatus Beckwithbacteria bacterium CG23_combo_of_CG06-09_8_20_14_all_34_8 TaxID=1974497 RepID=A0A2H0B5K1_9BACT|nr:MAG: hypothetical protein COX08_03625 [Candidatus Beckwithbacteria bacterium CG23_combo_of_CG06-09_8_20_14_all_34_8]